MADTTPITTRAVIDGARKFLWALAAAIVGTSGAILAAIDDDHISAKEGWGIGLAILALLVGPAAVYRARNRPTAAQAAAQAAYAAGDDGRGRHERG